MRGAAILAILLARPVVGAELPPSAPTEPATPHAVLSHPIPSLQEEKPGQAEVARLTLDQSIEEAIRNATAVQKARGETEFTGTQLIQGYAEFLPNLQATGIYNRTAGRAYLTTATPTMVDTVNHGPSYQISSTINVFNGFNDIAGLRSALARKSASDMTLRRAKQEIALDVAQSFLQVILDQELVRIAEKNLSSSQARENLLSEQTRVGVRNLADLFRQQAQTSADEAFLVNSQSKARTDELMLLRKLRLNADRNYRLIPPTFAEEAKATEFDDEDHLVQLALGNRPDLSASERLARAAEFEVTRSRANFYPRLDFGAVVGAAARTLDRQIVGGADVLPAEQIGLNDQLSKQVQYTVGFTLTWTLFDRWITQTTVERSRVNANNARIDEQDRHNQVVAEIRQAYGDYRAVLQQMESTRKGLRASQKAYEVMQGRYQVGSASFVDLTSAQAAQVQAEANRAQALIAYALQRRSMQTALGTAAVE